MPVPDFSGIFPNASQDDLKRHYSDFIPRLRNLLLTLDGINIRSVPAGVVDVGGVPLELKLNELDEFMESASDELDALQLLSEEQSIQIQDLTQRITALENGG